MNKHLEDLIFVGIPIVAISILASFGYYEYRVTNMRNYAYAVEKENRQLKIDLIQKDLDYLNRENCQNISMRVVNMNNEVKDVQFICDAMNPENQRYVTIVVDGVQKNYEYTSFMRKVFSVECGDDFKW